MEPQQIPEPQNSLPPKPPTNPIYWIVIGLAAVLAAGGIVYYANKPQVDDSNTLVKHQDEFKDWKTYTNPEYGFEFKYPADLGPLDDKNIDSYGLGMDMKGIKVQIKAARDCVKLENFYKNSSGGSEKIEYIGPLVNLSDGAHGIEIESNYSSPTSTSRSFIISKMICQPSDRSYSLWFTTSDGTFDIYRKFSENKEFRNHRELIPKIISTFKFTLPLVNDPAWETFKNEKFGFVVSYPSGFGNFEDKFSFGYSTSEIFFCVFDDGTINYWPFDLTDYESGGGYVVGRGSQRCQRLPFEITAKYSGGNDENPFKLSKVENKYTDIYIQEYTAMQPKVDGQFEPRVVRSVKIEVPSFLNLTDYGKKVASISFSPRNKEADDMLEEVFSTFKFTSPIFEKFKYLGVDELLEYSEDTKWNFDVANTFFTYIDNDKGFYFLIPYNDKWGNTEIKLKPSEQTADGKIYFGNAYGGCEGGCAIGRDMYMYVDKYKSAQDIIAELKGSEYYEYMFPTKPTILKFNSLEAVKYEMGELKADKYIIVVGKKFNYVFSGVEAPFEDLEQAAKTLKLID